MPVDSPAGPFQYGQIVVVSDFLDPQGRNPKDRPCVIVTDPKSPTPEGTQLVVAISTIIPNPLPADHVLLPWQDPRHPVTGLNKRNAAICPWVAEVEVGRISKRLGVVPGKQLRLIAEALSRLKADGA